MKKVISFLMFLCLIGSINASADSPAGVKIIHDVKYGSISNKFFIYLSLTNEWSKTAKLNLARVFDSYQKTRDFDAILQKQGKEFQAVRDGMVGKVNEGQMDKSEVVKYDTAKRTELAKRRDDKVREILTEIQKAVSDYAVKHQIRAVLNDRAKKLKGDEIDITDEIIPILNNQYASQASTDSQSDSTEGLESKLKTLNKLLADGLITKDDFDAKKKALLDNYTSK